MDSIISSVFEPHYEVRKKTIELIGKVAPDQFDNEENKTLTDYEKQDQTLEYREYILPYFRDHIKRVFSLDNHLDIKTYQMWFQIYNKGDFHNWHTHHKVQLNLIYFLKMPDTKSKTQFRRLDGTPIEYEATEGDIILSPACLPHKSPNITDNREKIMIGLNFDIVFKNI